VILEDLYFSVFIIATTTINPLPLSRIDYMDKSLSLDFMKKQSTRCS